MISVLIADDHHLVRQGICALLEKAPDILIAGEAENGLLALQKIDALQPDVVVLDVAMPGLNGLEVLQRLNGRRPKPRAVMLSMHADAGLVRQALHHGAIGYVLKRSVSEELLAAVRSAERGELYLSPGLDAIPPDPEHPYAPAPFERLTRRERDVLKLIAEGKSNQETAQTLNLSIKTIEKHRARLVEKLGARDLPTMMRVALRYGLIFLDE